MPRRAFTLLESLVALTVLALVAGACLELRAGALANTRTLAGRQDQARTAQMIFDLALAGFLGTPERADPEDPESALIWTGERDGAEYRLQRNAIVITNPVRASAPGELAASFPSDAALFRYALELGGETYHLEWNR